MKTKFGCGEDAFVPAFKPAVKAMSAAKHAVYFKKSRLDIASVMFLTMINIIPA